MVQQLATSASQVDRRATLTHWQSASERSRRWGADLFCGEVWRLEACQCGVGAFSMSAGLTVYGENSAAWQACWLMLPSMTDWVGYFILQSEWYFMFLWPL